MFDYKIIQNPNGWYVWDEYAYKRVSPYYTNRYEAILWIESNS